jgi:hypothetical protein
MKYFETTSALMALALMDSSYAKVALTQQRVMDDDVNPVEVTGLEIVDD